jgi:hypothetical protein
VCPHRRRGRDHPAITAEEARRLAAVLVDLADNLEAG